MTLAVLKNTGEVFVECVHAFFLKIDLFIWLCWVFFTALGLSLVAIEWVSHCGGVSCFGAQALGTLASVTEAHGLRNCGSWT